MRFQMALNVLMMAAILWNAWEINNLYGMLGTLTEIVVRMW